MRISFKAFSGSTEPRGTAIAFKPKARGSECSRHQTRSRLGLFTAAASAAMIWVASVASPVNAQVSLHEPFLEEFKAYTEAGDPLSESRMEVALSYNQRLWAAFNFFKDHMQAMPYDADGRAFVNFFKYDGDIRDKSLIGDFAWDYWGQWGISARYCDNFLLVYYRPDVKFKSGLTAQDIHMAPWVRAANKNATRRLSDKYIDVFSLPVLDWIIDSQIERNRSANVDIPSCIRDNYFDKGPRSTVALFYKGFQLDNFPFFQHKKYEYRTAACDAGDIGEGKRQRRFMTRWKSPSGGWTEDWQAGAWETQVDCHPPRVMKTFYTDTCFASQVGFNGETIPRVWLQYLVEVPDPAQPEGTNWVLSDKDGNVKPTMKPELFYSMCDENAPPVIESVVQGPKSSVKVIACDVRHARPYRPEVPWTGEITRTETWDETLQRVPFEELKELRIRENIKINEVNTCRRELREDEGNWDFSTRADCANQGVRRIRRKIFPVYEDRGSSGPHVNASTMSVVRTEYGAWEVYQNACYHSVSSTFQQNQNVGCGSGYSGYISQRRTVTRVSTRYEVLSSLNSTNDTPGPWMRLDNRCYYIATDTWHQEQLSCQSGWYTRQRRTFTHRLRVWQDRSKGRNDLGVSVSGWRNVTARRLIAWDYALPNDEWYDWQRSNCSRPGQVGDVKPSHPGVSPSGNSSDKTSYDVDGDGHGDYATRREAIVAGYKSIRAVDGGCGACNGPKHTNKKKPNRGKDGDATGNDARSFWEKVKDLFSGRRR